MSSTEYLKKSKTNHLLYPLDKMLVDKLLPIVPRFIETYHLTLFTLIWSSLVILSSYLGSDTRFVYLFIAVLIIMQYLTDLLDGAIGRARNTGLILWGFFMDHFLTMSFYVLSV